MLQAAEKPHAKDCRWQLRRVSDMSSYGRTPKLMPIHADRPTVLGRGSQSVRPDYLLESTAQSMMPSRQHARLHPSPDGGVDIEDLSVNGTYVNFVRIEKMRLVRLAPGDILVFGHRNGVNIQHGESVPTFRSELKFVFEAAASPGPVEAVKRRLSETADADEAAGADSNSNSTVKRPRLASDEAQEEAPSQLPAQRSSILAAPLTPLPVNSLALTPSTPQPAAALKTPNLGRAGTPGSGNKSKSQWRAGGRKSRQPRQQQKRHQQQPRTIDLLMSASETAGADAAAAAAAAIAAAEAAAAAQPDEGPCALGGDCGLPVGPNLLWVGCDSCLAWYHAACTPFAGCTEAELEAINFLCRKCQ